MLKKKKCPQTIEPKEVRKNKGKKHKTNLIGQDLGHPPKTPQQRILPPSPPTAE
jgi:hypothetical protein